MTRPRKEAAMLDSLQKCGTKRQYMAACRSAERSGRAREAFVNERFSDVSVGKNAYR